MTSRLPWYGVFSKINSIQAAISLLAAHDAKLVPYSPVSPGRMAAVGSGELHSYWAKDWGLKHRKAL